MTRREELAEKILLKLLATPAQMACCAGGPENVAGWARSIADAFLAACEPEVEPEREPDAVLHVGRAGGGGYFDCTSGPIWGTSGILARLLAGRDRVELEVRVREVKP